MSLIKTSNGSTWKNKTRTIKEMNFFCQDRSGRGFKVNLNQKEVRTRFTGERSNHGEAVSTFARRADVGDVWKNSTLEITRTQ